MFFARQGCTALLLITLTLWLQCRDIDTLITWVRGAVEGD
jgi:hypothetical protein